MLAVGPFPAGRVLRAVSSISRVYAQTSRQFELLPLPGEPVDCHRGAELTGGEQPVEAIGYHPLESRQQQPSSAWCRYATGYHPSASRGTLSVYEIAKSWKSGSMTRKLALASGRPSSFLRRFLCSWTKSPRASPVLTCCSTNSSPSRKPCRNGARESAQRDPERPNSRVGSACKLPCLYHVLAVHYPEARLVAHACLEAMRRPDIESNNYVVIVNLSAKLVKQEAPPVANHRAGAMASRVARELLNMADTSKQQEVEHSDSSVDILEQQTLALLVAARVSYQVADQVVFRQTVPQFLGDLAKRIVRQLVAQLFPWEVQLLVQVAPSPVHGEAAIECLKAHGDGDLRRGSGRVGRGWRRGPVCIVCMQWHVPDGRFQSVTLPHQARHTNSLRGVCMQTVGDDRGAMGGIQGCDGEEDKDGQGQEAQPASS
eukprot:scaffold1146_cov399-Prasinococcus_capsulatus_cf.AAC.37